MKRDIIITVVFCALELLLAFAPWIPQVSRVIPQNPSEKDAMDAMLALGGIHAAVLLTYVGLMLSLHSFDRRNEVHSIRSGMKRGEVRQLRDDEFYQEFLQRAKTANSYVYVSYFAPYPPSDVKSTERNKYYEDILKTIRRKQNVTFRRLVRFSQENRAWLSSLVNDLDGKHNANLGIIRESTESEMGHCLSVQIIDGEYSWFVATESHERQGEYRDLSIDDKLIAKELAAYHNRLWVLSEKLVDSGRVTDIAKDILEN